jgi:hypothetical protein
LEIKYQKKESVISVKYGRNGNHSSLNLFFDYFSKDTEILKGKYTHKKSTYITESAFYFAPPNIILSNHFNDELLKFAKFYESKVNSLVPLRKGSNYRT